MCRGTVFVIAALVSLSSCKKSGEENSTSTGYTLTVSGVGDSVAVGGTLDITVQIKKDGTNYSVSEEKIELSGKVTCGTNTSELGNKTASNDGAATFAPFALDSNWSGACTINISTTIAGQKVSTTHSFSIGTSTSNNTNNKKASDTDINNSDTGLIPQEDDVFAAVTGLEFVLDALEHTGVTSGGFLFLKDCQGGQLISIDDNDLHPEDSDGKVQLPAATDREYVVVGETPSSCALMYTASDTGAGEKLADVVPSATDSPASGKVTAISKHTSNTKTVVTTQAVSDGKLYVYDNSNSTWQKVDDVKWGATTETATNWDNVVYNNRALVRVASGDKGWWSLTMGVVVIGEVQAGINGGRLFNIAGFGTSAVSVGLTAKACGIRVFYFVEGAHGHVRELSTTGLSVTPNNSGVIGNFFAVGNLQAGCNLSLVLAKQTIAATKTVKITPSLPALTVRRSYSNWVSFRLDPRVNTVAAYIFSGGFTGDHYKYANWSGHSTTITKMNWDSDASKNRVLAVINTRGHRHVLYGEGS